MVSPNAALGDLDSPETPYSRSTRSQYSTAQLHAYFSYIALPPVFLSSPLLTEPILARTSTHGLPFLSALIRHHMVKIPYENLALHYSPFNNRLPNDGMLDLQEIYELIINGKKGRGGQCLQMNGIFGTVLRSLGFEVMSTGARTNTACQDVARSPHYRGPSYNCWDHMVNLVTLSSQRYLVDVGMNARGPIVPLPLISGASAFSISPRMARLLHSSIPEHTTSHDLNLMWRMEVRNHESSPWIPTYAFSEIEFLPVDFEMMNWYTVTSPRSWFTHKILVGRMVLDSQMEEIVGDVTLFERTMRKRINGEVMFEVECKSERQRFELLQEHFGIKLTDVERQGIVGKASQIHSTCE